MKEPRISNPYDVFSPSNIYLAPVFQRLYVWEADDWTSLFEELVESSPESVEFVGAIVLRDLGKEKGTISPNTYLMIDGQQRLTTLYLALVALSQIAREAGRTEDAAAITENFLVLSRTPQFNGRPKLVPTLQDRSGLWRILREAQPNTHWEFAHYPAEEETSQRSLLTLQWERILGDFRSHVVAEGVLNVEGFHALLEQVQRGLRFIEIVLNDQDDANAIFSSLNAKGQPLALVDLVRNEVFHSIKGGNGKQAEDFYRKQWHPFEKRFPAGTLDNYFPVFAYVVFEGKVSKAKAFPKLQESWEKKEAPEILDALEDYAAYFLLLAGVKLPADSRFDRITAPVLVRTERISRMPRSLATWPFLIRLLRELERGVVGAETVVKVFDILEAYLVRRLLIGIEPTGIQSIFKRMWSVKAAELAAGEPDCVLGPLKSASQDPPSDAELAKVLMDLACDKRTVLPYVFQEYEAYLVARDGGDPSPDIIESVEHILPQKPKEEGWTSIPPDERRRLVGLLGNLLPLSGKQNKSLQNGEWDKKSVRFKNSNYKAARAVSESKEWTRLTIENRTKDLVTWIQSRWQEVIVPRQK